MVAHALNPNTQGGRQVDLCEFGANRVYKASPGQPRVSHKTKQKPAEVEKWIELAEQEKAVGAEDTVRKQVSQEKMS